jgi:2'-5' RNA ligase
VAPGLKWVPADSLHITLRFLGHLERAVLDQVIENARRVRFEPFSLRLAHQGTFGSGRRIRVVWLGVEAGEPPLRQLAADVEKACAAAGLPPDERPFRAHVTLARARGAGLPLPDLPVPPELPAFKAREFQLYRSRLSPTGSTYSVLERFAGPVR